MVKQRDLTQQHAEDAYAAIVQAFGEQPHSLVVRQGGDWWPEGPVLCENFEGWTTFTRWAIVWEGGPFEWVHHVPRDVVPDNVFIEPINGFALGLYPAWDGSSLVRG